MTVVTMKKGSRKKDKVKGLLQGEKMEVSSTKGVEVCETALNKVSESRVFTPFKTLGRVSTHVPLLLRYIHRRRENFIITSSGRAVHTFVGQQLKLISTTEDIGGEMTCMAGDTYHVYTARVGGEHILAYRRGTELVHKYPLEQEDDGSGAREINHLLPFGSNLVAIDNLGKLSMFDIKTEELLYSVVLPVQGISCVIHPLTLQNKILIGNNEGVLTLWNVNTNQLIHQFERFRGSRVNTVVQAPARGVVAVGLGRTNKVVLFNVIYDVVIMELNCLEEPKTIAFRTDGPQVMVVGGGGGSLAAWNLDNKEMICYIKEAHRTSVSGVVFFMSEPIFVSSSSDNAVRVWIFDKPDGGFRLLNSREGHVEPPSIARFHWEESPMILTTGIDNTIRSFHLFNETYNRIITNFTGSKESGGKIVVDSFVNYRGHHQPIGEDIVAFNSFRPGEVYTFSYLDCKRGKSILNGVDNNNLVIKCAQITSDQQWVILGFNTGSVNVHNLQSKRLKSSFKVLPDGEMEEVMGLALSATESTLCIGTMEHISFNKFPGGQPIKKQKLEWPVRKVFSRPFSNLCGIVLGNFEILVCDISTFQVIRRLRECRAPVTDATFSPDMKWVTAATNDGCVLSWDVPTGNLIDIFRDFYSPITSLDYSPRGDFIVTTHAYEVGINLWINKTVFEACPLLTRIPPNYYPKSAKDVIPFEVVEEDTDMESSFKIEIPMSFLSLGTPPKYHWKELLNLKAIKVPGPADDAPVAVEEDEVVEEEGDVHQQEVERMEMPSTSTGRRRSIVSSIPSEAFSSYSKDSPRGVAVKKQFAKDALNKSLQQLGISPLQSQALRSTGKARKKIEKAVTNLEESFGSATSISLPSVIQPCADCEKLCCSIRDKLPTQSYHEKARNKPAPAFKPKQVIPFFLSDLDKDNEKDKSPEGQTSSSLVPMSSSSLFLSPLAKELDDILNEKSLDEREYLSKCESWVLKLSELGPSQVDVEIRSWDPDFGGSLTILENFVNLAGTMTRYRKHVQLIHTCLALFLKVYRKHLQSSHDLRTSCQFCLLVEESEKLRRELLESCLLIESLLEFSTESLF